MAVKNGSSKANLSNTSFSVSGNTTKTGTLSWTNPTLPDNATITGTTLTGTLNISMSKGHCTVTLNGTDYTETSQINLSLGTSLKTSTSISYKGNNKNATGTITFSDFIYTINYTYDDGNGVVLIHVGNNIISSAYLGNTPIDKIYIGTTLVYEV